MEYKDGIEKNKAYVNLGMNDSKKNKLLENCKNKKEEIKSGTIDLNLRRNEKMNKEKTRLDLLPKVCVASVSLIATGAIIFGVSRYNANHKSINSSKVTVTTEKVEKIEEKYNKVFDGVIRKGIVKDSFDTSIGQVELGDYVYEIEGSDMEHPEIDWQTCMWLSIKGKNDEKFTELKDFKFEDKDDVYSDGKYVFAKYQNYLNKYDIENNKLEQIDICKAKSLTENRDKAKYGEYTGIYKVVTVKNGIIYLNIRREREAVNDGGLVAFDLVGYNINSNDFSVEIEKYYMSYEDYEDYMVAQHKNDEDVPVLVLYKFTSDGLKEEKQIDEKIEYQSNSTASKSVIYYIGDGVYEKMNDDGYEYEVLKKFKLYSYDIKNDVKKELTEIDIKDFGEDAYNISNIEFIYDDMCVVVINKKEGGVQDYKYTYATKKVEKMERAD